MQTLMQGQILKNLTQINKSCISNRLDLKDQDIIDFINQQMEVYKVSKNPKSSNQDLINAYNLIELTINKEETYFNRYLEFKIQKRLGINDSTTKSALETKFNDEYSQKLFKDLKQNF